MKFLKSYYLLALLGWLILTAVWLSKSTAPRAASACDLSLLTYQSMMGDQGFGAKLVQEFERIYPCHIQVKTTLDAGELLTRLELDAQRGANTAQIVLGLDQYLLHRAQPYLQSWGDWTPEAWNELDSNVPRVSGFLPFQMGALSWMADFQQLKVMGLNPPRRMIDLLSPEWRKKLLLQDPRTSTPGLVFLLQSQVVLGDEFYAFWKKFSIQWLTLTPGWDSAYSLFFRGEAPLVWSYITSQAYHESQGEGDRYQALLFEEGQPLQVEGAAWVKNSMGTEQQKESAKQFFNLLISQETQSWIPRDLWMMPVRSGVALPTSYASLPRVSRWISIPTQSEWIQHTLKTWRKSVGEGMRGGSPL